MELSDHPGHHDHPPRNAGDVDVPGATVHRGRRSVADLHICTECSSELVHPVDWTPLGTGHWRVELRCPDCEWRGADLYEQAVLDRFDTILDLATESMLDDLSRLQRENMEAEAERFADALRRDLILPEDF